MIPTTPKYWPFDVLPPEQRTDLHWQEIRFLDAAFQEGFKPFEQTTGEYIATSPRGREACIIFRGRGRRGGIGQWEVWLDEPETQFIKLWVDDFEYAGGLILEWLRGNDVTAILAASGGHILQGPQFTKAQTPTVVAGLGTCDTTDVMPGNGVHGVLECEAAGNSAVG